MTNEISIIIVLSLIIFASPLLSKLIKLPIVPIEIFLGSVAISYNFIESDHIFTLVAELGFLYLMFLAGLEVDLKQILKISAALFKKGLLYSIMLYIFAIIFTWLFDLANIFIVTLPLISIGLLATLKKEYGDVVWLNNAITIGLIGEIISIVVLTAVSAILEFGFSTTLYETLTELAIVFVVMILFYNFFHHLIWWYPELKTYLMPKHDNQEQDIRVSMSIFFLMIALMLYLHLELALGAFIAGVFIKTFFRHNTGLPHKLEHFGFGWLVPIFFIWIGTSFDLNALLVSNLVEVSLLITFSMIFMRIASSMILRDEMNSKEILLFALSHSMPLTLLIAVATLAYHNNSISLFYYHAFVLASIFEVIFSMIIIRFLHVKKEGSF